MPTCAGLWLPCRRSTITVHRPKLPVFFAAALAPLAMVTMSTLSGTDIEIRQPTGRRVVNIGCRLVLQVGQHVR